MNSSAITPTAAAAKFGTDDVQDLTDNDQDPTEAHPLDFHDWWTGNEPWREFTEDELHADPLLAHLLGKPNPIECGAVHNMKEQHE